MADTPPIITLTTDFGQADYYVAATKAVLLRHCPNAVLVDVTHQIEPQDVLGGAILLERAIASFEPGTTHLAVVDPGVGTDRRVLVVSVNGQFVVCPDNGLITWMVRRLQRATDSLRILGRNASLRPAVRIRTPSIPLSFAELIWRPLTSSYVFHGRDIMAPAAARIARGELASTFTRPIDDPVLLEVELANSAVGQVLHIDHFGNATTNITSDGVESYAPAKVLVRGTSVGPVRQTYADVAVGEALALIGSSGLLEIAVRNGSAARELHLSIEDVVELLR